MWAAYANGGLLAILDFAADDAVWIPYAGKGRRFESTGEYRRFIEETADRGDTVESEAFDFDLFGDTVMVTGTIRVRREGAIIDSSVYWVHRVKDGQVVWTQTFSSRDAALEAAGRVSGE
jgi:ketosteroid isomerase-like protein